jgi:glutathione gamma-glutamylcysteinyltransferase
VKKTLLAAAVIASLTAAAALTYVAYPTEHRLRLPAPLTAARPTELQQGGPYFADYPALARAFRPQAYRSFCGPASLATVLRAYGKPAEQRTVFPSAIAKGKAFLMGMSLEELASVARAAGLTTVVLHADKLTEQTFRTLAMTNLRHPGDYLIANYDRRVLQQSGVGHISVLGAYDPARDAVLVLDSASYRYPFTWVPVSLLFKAMHTTADGSYRGLLSVTGNANP